MIVDFYFFILYMLIVNVIVRDMQKN